MARKATLAKKTEAGVSAPAPVRSVAETVIRITPPHIEEARFQCIGEASHLSVNRFSEKAKGEIEATQKAGSTSKSKRKREPKDFEALFRAAQYRSPEGWAGLHAAALRNAMIAACALTDMFKTLAKKAIFIVQDGYDATDETPLIRIYGPEPEMWVGWVQNVSGVDLRPRPRWKPGWEIRPTIRYDADVFTLTDVTNLLMRVGFQVGLGEGRPDSKKSAGLGYGLFRVMDSQEEKAAA